jgi:O-antigen/teichoic acid export membrane protein
MFKKLLSKTNNRSVKAYKNIIGMFTLKGVNIAISLVMVPLTLNYLDVTRYGIWITLSAIFGWFSLFDIGLGNGLRNRLTEALAINDFKKARIYISTAYASLLVVFSGVFVLFAIANVFIDWTFILNTPKDLHGELSLLAGIVFFFFCMRFVTQLVSIIALAKQEPAFSQFLDVGGRIISFIGIFLLTRFTKGSLLYLGITLTALPVITSIFFSFYVFNNQYKELKPSISLVRFNVLRSILTLGVKFFIIQITGIIFYETNNIIIAQLFGPAEVTPYNITFQFFNSVALVFSIIVTPYWSAFTDAFIKKDLSWIKKSISRLKLFWIILVIFMVIISCLADTIIGLWVGKRVVIPNCLPLVITIYLLLTAYNSINCSFLNGTGKVKIQLYIAIIFAFIHIPIAIYFCKQFGIIGILFSAIINTFITSIVYEVQYRKIILNKAIGIWNE